MIVIMNHPLEADLATNPLKRLSDDEQQDDIGGDQIANKRLRTTKAQPQQKGKKHVGEPNKHDVLCGRGGLINKHPGNVAFRRVVEANKQTYHSCKKEHKLLLSVSIVEAVHNQKPAGRFLTQEKGNDNWIDIGKTKAIQKTSQALREGAEKVRSSIFGGSSEAGDSSSKMDESATQDDEENPRKEKGRPTQEEINREVLRRAIMTNGPDEQQTVSLVAPQRQKGSRPARVKRSTRCVSTEPRADHLRGSMTTQNENGASNLSMMVEQEDNNSDATVLADSQNDCLPNTMDDFDLFSDDTIFDNLEDDGLDFIMALPLSPSSRVVDVYAGVPVIGAPNEEDDDEPLPLTLAPLGDDDDGSSFDATRRTGGTQNMIEPASSDDCVSVVSIDLCAQEEELLSSSEDDTVEDLLMTSLIPGLADSKIRAIWEL